MNLRKSAAIAVVVCLGLPSLPAASSSTDSSGLKRKIDLLGSGAQVKMKLSSGAKLRGRLAQVEEDAFLLATPDGAEQRRIAYAELAQIQPAKKHYRAAGAPEPDEARRAVVGLGVGHHVMVRLEGDKVVRGHIGAIDSDQFTLLPDGGAEALAIDYGSVHHVRKNPSTGTIIAIAAGAALATVLIVIWAIREHNE